jgi:spectinomycin phosphotransferase
MRNEPSDLYARALTTTIGRYWDINVTSLVYAPLGFGSYHWHATDTAGRRWFVTADRLETEAAFSNLEAAYVTAATLYASGLSFVVAPERDRSGELLRRVDANWGIAVFRHINGHAAGTGPWLDFEAAARAYGLVGQLHAIAPPPSLRRFDFTLLHRESLFDRLDEPWVDGPYGEDARHLLASARKEVEALLAHYDELVEELMGSDEPWALSHGEPHSANFIAGTDGLLYLIDWDTVRLAPPERDLGAALMARPDVLAAYQSTAGPRLPRLNALRLFDLWWHVSEICGYVHDLSRPHSDSEDDRVRWKELANYLQVKANWPDLF